MERREIQSRHCCPNLRNHTGVRLDAKIQGNRGWVGQVSRSAYQLEITSSFNGCSEKPLAPFVAHPEVVSSAEDLGHLEAECTHIRQVPSSVVRCTGLAGVGQGKIDERTCSAALDELGEDACGTVATTCS